DPDKADLVGSNLAASFLLGPVLHPGGLVAKSAVARELGLPSRHERIALEHVMHVAHRDSPALDKAGHQQLAVEWLDLLPLERIAHCPGLGRMMPAQGRIASDARYDPASDPATRPSQIPGHLCRPRGCLRLGQTARIR